MREECGLVTGISVDIARVIHSGLIGGAGGELMDPFVGLDFPHDGYLGLLSVVREVDTISDEFFAVRREHLETVGGLGSVSASFMPRLVQQLTESAHGRGLRVLVTPYAVATFEGVWPGAPSEIAPAMDHSDVNPDVKLNRVRLNPNLFAFENLADVLSGNV